MKFALGDEVSWLLGGQEILAAVTAAGLDSIGKELYQIKYNDNSRPVRGDLRETHVVVNAQNVGN